MGWTIRWSNPVTDNRSFSSPNPADPFSILFSGYRWLYLRSKGGRIVKLTTHLHLVPSYTCTSTARLNVVYGDACTVSFGLAVWFRKAPLISSVFRVLQYFSCGLMVVGDLSPCLSGRVTGLRSCDERGSGGGCR